MSRRTCLNAIHPSIESLESRQFLCADHGLAATTAGYSVPAAMTAAVGPTSTATTTASTAPTVNTRAAGGSWTTGPSSPIAIGEAAAGVINNKLYVVTQANTRTLRYDLVTKVWSSTAVPARPVHGDHHSAEVVNGKLYLIGGLTEYRGLTEPAGKVQIYNPATNTWSLGAAMPWKGGSVSTAVVNGKIYAAGGIIDSKPGAHAGTGSTTQVARYDPATNKWTMLAPMPVGVNHAAATTNGSRIFIFGGRTGANVLGNGINTAQRYDIATNTWISSNTSTLIKPLPLTRGGMGKAVFHNGEVYVFGGETLNGSGATSQRVYRRVDIYKPATNTWRIGTPIPTAVHGTFPVLWSGKIYLPGGGTFAGFSQSKILQIYTPG